MVLDFVGRSTYSNALVGELRRCSVTVRLNVKQVAAVLLAGQLLESRTKAGRCCRDFGDGKGQPALIILVECSFAVAKGPGNSVAGSGWTNQILIVDVDQAGADASEVGEGVVAEAPRYRSHPRLFRAAQVE